MGYYDRNYRLDEDYGDEDQNSLMWMIESWRDDDEAEDEDEPYEFQYCGNEASIDDFALGEGFWIDDDGHWRELPEEEPW